MTDDRVHAHISNANRGDPVTFVAIRMILPGGHTGAPTPHLRGTLLGLIGIATATGAVLILALNTPTATPEQMENPVVHAAVAITDRHRHHAQSQAVETTARVGDVESVICATRPFTTWKTKIIPATVSTIQMRVGFMTRRTN